MANGTPPGILRGTPPRTPWIRLARRTLIGALTAATLGMPGLGLAATEDADIVQREPMSDRQCSMFRALSRMIPANCVNPSQSGRIDTKGRLKIGRQRSTIGGPTSGRDDVVEQSKPPPGYLVIEEIQFDFDSDRLAQSARAVLDDLARVIKHSINHRVAFVVEGHADAVGQADYNQSLSERRAAEVS